MAGRRALPRLAAGVAAVVLLLAGGAAAAPPAGAAAPHARAAAKHGHLHPVTHHRRAHRRRSTAASASTPASAGPAPAAVAATAGGVAASGACGDGDLVPSPANLDRVRAATLCLVNQQRTGHGLAPLGESAGLDAAAQRHSDDMVSGNYFAHVGPTGVGLLDQVVAAGYAVVGRVLDVGENIAAADGSLASPAATVAGWMDSPEHRANILDPGYGDTGIGIAAAAPGLLGTGGRGATYTECFGAAG